MGVNTQFIVTPLQWNIVEHIFKGVGRSSRLYWSKTKHELVAFVVITNEKALK